MKNKKNLLKTIIILILIICVGFVHFNYNEDYDNCNSKNYMPEKYWYKTTCYEMNGARFSCEKYNYDAKTLECKEKYGGLFTNIKNEK